MSNTKLQQYKCHKVVWAAKIEHIETPAPDFKPSENNAQAFYPALLSLSGMATRNVSESWMAKHRPEVGGYFVEYEDGYSSFSPAATFESGYTAITGGYRFGDALNHLMAGKCVARSGWNGKGMFIWLNKGSCESMAPEPTDRLIGGVPQHLFDLGDTGTVTRMPNINMRAADGSTVTGWLASQTDMLATDWQVLE